MGANIHPSSVIHKGASLAESVTVGPFCTINDDVQIASGTVIMSNVTVDSGSRIGKNCKIWPGAVIGGAPQDHKYRGERSLMVLGDNNIVRECVTLHRAVGEGVATRIGNDNMFMAYAHVGHNCEIGNNNTISSYVGLSGHVLIEDNVIFGGMVGVHQFCRIGKMAMIGGFGKVNLDVPPFMLADGLPVRVVEVNTVGLRRHGIPPSVRSVLRHAYKIIYRSRLNMSQALERIEDELEPSDELDYLVQFLQGTRQGTGGRGNVQKR
ncbi:MAG: acyl-ACP--UDP-N-acetylglucosamine O-acyltransferase [Chthonomonadales bacterium]